ncbi:MAG: ABC-2 transporter permease, partial [Firmicutes bacterium]|nr:ABC-2 transporter permease [Bacillota bacterium]
DQWNKFAFTMPVTRRQAVLAKYIFGLLLCCLGLACGLGLTLLTRAVGIGDGSMSFGGVLVEALASCGVVLLIVSLMVPLNLKFGIQKSRYLLLGFVAVPVLLGILVTKLELKIPSMMYLGVKGMSTNALIAGAVLLVLAVLLVSYLISVRIMEKKEF